MEHLLPMPVERLLQYGIGFFWTITYIQIIFHGFRDRTCGMPFAALCANFTWEFLFAFVFPFEQLQLAADLLWFVLDFIILCQLVYYSKSLYKSWNFKYLLLFPSLVLAFLLNFGVTVEFHDFEGKYTGFGINLMMSLLFIRMLIMQGSRGQSISIAYTKMIGTLCASILFFSLYPASKLLPLLYVLIFILDVIYIVMIHYQSIRVIRRSRVNEAISN